MEFKSERINMHTGSGMLCLCNFESFKNISDYDSWDKELCEDENIIRPIKNAEFVPINLGDGAFELEVSFSPNIFLTKREEEYLIVKSKNYLLKSTREIKKFLKEDAIR